MLISGREARALLQAAGFSSRHARTALGSGLAGEPVRTRAVHLYDEARVRELADRPTIDWPTVNAACPQGLLVTRRELDMTRPRAELLEETSSRWDCINPWVRLSMSFQIRREGSVPFLVTVAGVVVLGADIVGGRERCGLRLSAPGAWFDGLDGGRLSMGPGRPWVLLLS